MNRTVQRLAVRNLPWFALCPALLALCQVSLPAQSVPALINYQGRLSNPDGSPLPTADYQLTFKIYDSATNVGGLVWGPQVFDGQPAQGHGATIPVVQGYFNVMLGPADTNGASLAGAFGATNRFVEITISNHSPILPRQQVLSAPFALQAANSATLAGSDWSAVFGTNDPVNGRIPTARIGSGAVTAQQIASNQVWLASGNIGTVPGSNFIGTSDNQALELKVNGQRALRLVPSTPDPPNLIGGFQGNTIVASSGATIAGGGLTNYPNQINGTGQSGNGSYAFIGGGAQNTVSASFSVLGGGLNNTVTNVNSFLGGGQNNFAGGAQSALVGGVQNSASGDRSFVGGGLNNVAAGYLSAIPGGTYNQAAGLYSFAAGSFAHAVHDGTFVWHDATSTDGFNSAGSNQFLVYASGGVGIGKNNPASALDVNGTITANSFAGSNGMLTMNGVSGTTISNGLPVYVNSSGQLGNQTLRQTGTNVGLGGLAVSLSSGLFTSPTPAVPTTVPNLFATLATQGNPVEVTFVSDGTTNQSCFEGQASSSLYLDVLLLRDGVVVGREHDYVAPGPTARDVPPGAFRFLDTPARGTHTYTVQITTSGGGNVALAIDVIMVAREL